MQEFFPEGGRSRTGKLLPARLGLFTWEVDAILQGARDDLYFVPASIDYEKVVESHSYSKELAGGEKKPEDLKALLKAPKVLASRYGRIHVNFDEPISLVEFARARGLDLKKGITDEEKKSLVRALGHRTMWGIGRVSTITPQALLSSALLAHRGRGITARELGERIGLLPDARGEGRHPALHLPEGRTLGSHRAGPGAGGDARFLPRRHGPAEGGAWRVHLPAGRRAPRRAVLLQEHADQLDRAPLAGGQRAARRRRHCPL